MFVRTFWIGRRIVRGMERQLLYRTYTIPVFCENLMSRLHEAPVSYVDLFFVLLKIMKVFDDTRRYSPGAAVYVLETLVFKIK